MQIKKSELEVFYKVLKQTNGELSFKDARIRDRFMKPLGEQVDALALDRTKIYEKFCKKEEDGITPALQYDKDEKGENIPGTEKYAFNKADAPAVDAEILVLYDEEVSLDIENPEKIKELIENTEYKPLYGEADVLDGILAKF